MVKKQLENDEVDVISNQRFDAKKNELGMDFQDLVSIDTNKLQSAFDINIDEDAMREETAGYMAEINDSITTDTAPAKEKILNNLNMFANGVFKSINGTVSLSEVDSVVDTYL